MNRATLLFTRKGRGPASDDRIQIRSLRNSYNIFKVTYHTPELRMDRSFYTSFEGAMNYVEDVLRSMRHDSDPFEHVQIYTAVHPSTLFHVSSLDEEEPYNIILNMIRDVLRHQVVV